MACHYDTYQEQQVVHPLLKASGCDVGQYSRADLAAASYYFHQRLIHSNSVDINHKSISIYIYLINNYFL